jgi:uncharacterized protein (DUF433 family)/predicted nucleotidyltransferase
MNEQTFLKRITVNRKILDGKPAIRERLTVERALELLATGGTFETMVESYPWLEKEDIQACLVYARRLVLQEQAKPLYQQPQTLEDLIELIPQVLEQVPYLKLLVLFGSRARGDHYANSDWDFAFLCDEELRKQYEKGSFGFLRIWGILQQVYKLGDDQIDAIEMRECSNILAHNIATDGRILYELEPGEFAAFQREKLIAPEAMKRLQKEMREDLRKRVQELQK